MYTNPVIPGFYPDPSVCRVGDTYYLVTSSFTYFPGVPLFRSTDLVHWDQIGNVLDRTSQLDLSKTGRWASLGNFAPTIRHHDGRFYMITTVTDPTRMRNFFVTATDPAGPWSDPVDVDVLGIDPDIAWDDEGNCWVHFAGEGGINRVCIDDRTGALLSAPERTWSGTGMVAAEAPHLLRRDGAWYLLVAEGGTERGHAVSIARGPSPEGPWEPGPANPLVSHRSTGKPIQNTGHADLVEAPDGSWWMVLLGVRPRGQTPLFHVLGRETFLAPVEWVDGWPRVADLEVEMPYTPPGTGLEIEPVAREDFDGPALEPSWIAVRRPAKEFASLTERPGWLVLSGDAEGLAGTMPAYVARRQQHHQFRARTRVAVDDSAEGGLALLMDERSWYSVGLVKGTVVVTARIGPLCSRVGEAPVSGADDIVVFVETRAGERGSPDLVVLGYEDGDERHELAELDGRYLSTEVCTGFIGRTIGMYAAGGPAAFDWFAYEA